MRTTVTADSSAACESAGSDETAAGPRFGAADLGAAADPASANLVAVETAAS